MSGPNVTTLRSLASRLEAATGPDRALDARLWMVTLPRVGVGFDGYGLPDGAHYKYDYDASEDYVRMYVFRGTDRLGGNLSRAARRASLFTSSLDAAIALVERHGFGWCIDQVEGGILSDADDCFDGARAATPPLSMCLALVRALITRAERRPAALDDLAAGHRGPLTDRSTTLAGERPE